jgi:hypothetical protein
VSTVFDLWLRPKWDRGVAVRVIQVQPFGAYKGKSPPAIKAMIRRPERTHSLFHRSFFVSTILSFSVVCDSPGKGLFDVSRDVTQTLRKTNMRPEHPRYAERSILEPRSETLKLSLRYTKTG